jgi:hypothetical protein
MAAHIDTALAIDKQDAIVGFLKIDFAPIDLDTLFS